MNQHAPILFVEDNEDDILFLRRAVRQIGIADPLAVVNDGQAALNYLSGAMDPRLETNTPVPRLVLLDLKLPYKNGLEVLQWIRSQKPLKSLPVIMFTTSAERADVDRAYDLGANAYLVKPSSFDSLISTVRAIKSFWIDSNISPIVGCRDGSEPLIAPRLSVPGL